MDGATLHRIGLFIQYAWPLLLLLSTYVIGTIIEKRHFSSIRQREQDCIAMPVVSFDTMPDDWQAGASTLVTGSIVISLDYFKRVVAGLRALFGGRIKTYEPLLDRARREAVLRMIEDAQSQGFDAVFNVRLQTSRLANSWGEGNSTAGVEMLAFGTAVKLGSGLAPGPERS
jgi:uncharacterized protein YbjQ (UPF0145 family)